jgi:hypothetical protein
MGFLETERTLPMKPKYLLSSLAIHAAIALLLAPLVLLPSPLQANRSRQVLAEIQKTSEEVAGFAASKTLQRIVVTATKEIVRPAKKSSARF